MPSLNKYVTLALILITSSILTSCGIYGRYSRARDLLVPDSISGVEGGNESDSLALGALPWSAFFSDPTLQSLISEALRKNTDLGIARLNVEKAEARLLMSGLSFAPDLGFRPSAKRDHLSGQGWTKENAYTLPFTSSWEPDLSGRLLNNYRAGEASLSQTGELRRLTETRIISSVANVYYTLRMLDRQLAVAEEAKRVMDQTAETMEILLEAGRMTAPAVAQAKAQAKLTQVTINDLRHQIVEAENSMRLLLMTPSLAVPRPSEDFTDLPPEMIHVGIPLDLLSNRPDVRAAEDALRVTFYGTQAARSAFLPSLTLTASGTWLNKLGETIINPMAFVTSIAANAFQPILRKGQNVGQLKIARANQEQALRNYEKTILSASNEVSNLLAQYKALEEDKKSTEEEIALRTQAEEQTLELMSLTGVNYLEVLTSQSQRLSAELRGVVTEFRRTQTLINLWRALGGGDAADSAQRNTARPISNQYSHKIPETHQSHSHAL